MSIENLYEVWVAGSDAYATYEKAKRAHPDDEPQCVIYRDAQWPKLYYPEPEAGPVSYREPEVEESLDGVINRAWSSWEANNAKYYQR